MIDLEKEQIHYTQVQYQAGTAPYASVLSLQTQLAASQATLPPLRQLCTQAKNLLAQLSGQLPAEQIPHSVPLSELTLPEEVPVRLPSQLVRRRPDILAAEAQLHSASARVGVATAELFPSISLSSSYGLGNMDTGKLFTSASGFWDLRLRMSPRQSFMAER